MSALTTYTSATRARNAVTHLVTTRASALTVSFRSGRIVSVRGEQEECGKEMALKGFFRLFFFLRSISLRW